MADQKNKEKKDIKAWEYLFELNKKSFPYYETKKKIDKEMMGMINRLFKLSDDYLIMLWKSTPDSGAHSCLVAGAIGAARNKGLNVLKANHLFNIGLEAIERQDYIELHKITAQIFKSINEAPIIAAHKYFTYEHPENWDDYKDEIPNKDYGFDTSTADYEDKVYASWLGEIIGGAYGGGPFEGYNHKAIEKVFGNMTTYLGDPNTINDDINYELTFLEAFKEKGYDLTSEDIADKWLMYIPWGWTAETIALENLRRGIYPPQSGSFFNFFSEWIGAQMRGGVAGLVAPGKPKVASKLAFLDGQVSHEKNGIYSECYIAAMVSLSFVEKDIRKILVNALDYVPKKSEFHAVSKEALEICSNSDDWSYLVEKLENRFADYHWVHTYPNIWIVINSLYWSNGNFDEGIKIARMSGLDTDCNCGVVGAILGGVVGTKNINEEWYKPFDNVLKTYNMRGKFLKLKITELSSQTVGAVRKYW